MHGQLVLHSITHDPRSPYNAYYGHTVPKKPYAKTKGKPIYTVAGKVVRSVEVFSFTTEWFLGETSGILDRIKVVMDDDGTWRYELWRSDWYIGPSGNGMSEEKKHLVHEASLSLSISTRKELSSYILKALRDTGALEDTNPPPVFLQFFDTSDVEHTVRVQRASKSTSSRHAPHDVIVNPKGRGDLAVLDMSIPGIRELTCLSAWVI